MGSLGSFWGRKEIAHFLSPTLCAPAREHHLKIGQFPRGVGGGELYYYYLTGAVKKGLEGLKYFQLSEQGCRIVQTFVHPKFV